ncbi:hypothetical protein ACF05L_21285 [Streptomyces bobili]
MERHAEVVGQRVPTSGFLPSTDFAALQAGEFPGPRAEPETVR